MSDSATKISQFAIRLAFYALMSNLTIEEVFLAIGAASKSLACGESELRKEPQVIEQALELIKQAYGLPAMMFSEVDVLNQQSVSATEKVSILDDIPDVVTLH